MYVRIEGDYDTQGTPGSTLSLCAPSNIPSGPSATHLAGRGQNGKDLGADTLSFQPYPQRQKTCAIQIVSSEVAKVDYPQTRCTCRVLL